MFKPGQSGNLKGRPPGKRGIAALASKCTPANIAWLEKIRDAPGNKVPWSVRFEAVALLLAYGHGKPSQAVQHSGKVGGEGSGSKVLIYNNYKAAHAVADEAAEDETISDSSSKRL